MNQFKNETFIEAFRKFKSHRSATLSEKVMEICKGGKESPEEPQGSICFLCDEKDLCVTCDSSDWNCASNDGLCIFEDGGDIVDPHL
jgi:hypothetical protein